MTRHFSCLEEDWEKLSQMQEGELLLYCIKYEYPPDIKTIIITNEYFHDLKFEVLNTRQKIVVLTNYTCLRAVYSARLNGCDIISEDDKRMYRPSDIELWALTLRRS